MLEIRTTGEMIMGRYPFAEGVNEYLPTEEGHLEDETIKSLRRRLNQIAKIMHQLKEEGKISSDNPKKMTPEDIDVFVGFRRKSGVKASTVNKDLGNLKKMFIYFDNDVVSKFEIKYPSHYPKRYKRRGASLEERSRPSLTRPRRSTLPIGSSWRPMAWYLWPYARDSGRRNFACFQSAT